MVFVSGKHLIEHAFKNNYGIGAFSVHNVETIQAIIEAAEEEQSPIMIQIGQRVIQEVGLESMKCLVDVLGKDSKIPIAVHLDHSRDFAQTMRAIQLGFQSVMFDGSAFSFEENVGITSQVSYVARELGIGSEGEIGRIGGTEDDITVEQRDALITTVEEAHEFALQTKVDYLAISIGSAHGIYKEKPNLRLERLKEISNKINKPIVLHGGSDIPGEQVKQAIKRGVAKINVDTELRKAFITGVQQFFKEQPDNYVLAEAMEQGKVELRKIVKEKIHLFGSQKQATNYFNEHHLS